MVTKSVERGPSVWEIGTSISSWDKPMAYTMNACPFLARCSALLGWGTDWFVQRQDTVTAWDIRSWCWWPGFPVGRHYKITTRAHCHKTILVLIWPHMLLGCKTTNKHKVLCWCGLWLGFSWLINPNPLDQGTLIIHWFKLLTWHTGSLRS